MKKDLTNISIFFGMAAICALLLLAPAPAKADIFEVNNAGSCAGGGSAGGGLCYQVSPGVWEPYSLSGLLSGAYGPISIGPGTTEYVVTDDMPGGTFSYVYSSTTDANNAVCQIDGGTTAYFAPSSTGCTVVDSIGDTNTGTLNKTSAFNTGAQINSLMPPATITFNATGGYGQTFDLGFVSMQGTGTISSPEGSSVMFYLALGLAAILASARLQALRS